MDDAPLLPERVLEHPHAPNQILFELLVAAALALQLRQAGLLQRNFSV